MQIAIASGKGGTGKTTIATNLAYTLAQAGKAVQYLDCDAEEPNGHIFLQPIIEETQTVTMGVPEVNAALCNGCGKCGELCQYSAIICLKNRAMTFTQLCHSCGGCMLVCPTGAIRETPKEIGYTDVGMAKGIRFGQGRLKIGDIHTPALIKWVKSYAMHEGIVIIDAPPGTSCPVIEAVKGSDFVLLVTEPTPFGLNDLQLAVAMVQALRIPFAVAVNRSEPDNQLIHQYCQQYGIDIVLEVPDDRRIAEAYSVGSMVIDVLPNYLPLFSDLYETLSTRINQDVR